MSRSQVPIALSIIWMALNRLLVQGNHVRNRLGLKALVTNSPIGVQHLPTLCPCCRRLCQTAHIPDL